MAAALAFFVASPVQQGPEVASAQVATPRTAVRLKVPAAPAKAQPEAKGEDNNGSEEASEQVSADIKAKVRAALHGAATVEIERNEGGGYEAELTDGREVLLNDQFQIVGHERGD